MTSIFSLETWIGVTQSRWAGDQIVHDILASWKADRKALLAEKAELLAAAKAFTSIMNNIGDFPGYKELFYMLPEELRAADRKANRAIEKAEKES